jgi:hypothetical protein
MSGVDVSTCRLSLHLALRIAAYFDVPVEVVFSLKPFKRLGE